MNPINLPQNINTFFSSNEPRLNCEQATFMYGLQQGHIKFISLPVGQIFVNEIKLKDLATAILKNFNIPSNVAYGIAYEINKRIFNKFPEYFKDSNDLLNQWSRLKSAPLISEDEAWKKVLELEPWILEIEQEEEKKGKSQEQKIQSDLINLNLSDALRQFPEIGEQMITSEKIKLKNFPESVRPSLKNWLADYTFTVGYDNKDSIKRGNYIFHDNNTMRLLAADREKLAYILKAHDENTPITINKETKQVVFPAPAQRYSTSSEQAHPQKPTTPSFNAPQSSASLRNSVSFSSPQQLPYEKIHPVKSDEIGATGSQFNRVNTPQPAKQELVSRVKFPPYQQPRSTNTVTNIVRLEPKPEKPREVPRNVVNLREF